MMGNKKDTVMPSAFGRWIVCLKILLILPLFIAMGCGNGLPENRGIVTGKVTVDGESPESGGITFTPVDGASPTSGGTIENGSYSVKAPTGLAKISIRVPEVVGEQKLYDTPDSPVQPITQESLPEKYNTKTELTFEVMHGENEKDFDLSTK